ncbi:MAG: acetolactate synthase, partial [Leptospiraceae bacterium]|nr:acetolactate synthase [Leptospiraceae bacterium]
MNQFETGAECIIRFLEEIKTEYISGIPGGANLPLYDALYSSNIQHILARHEQGAGFIAQGISRSSNKLGICFVTSGPGFTNAVTAIADANMDSIPMLIFSGQVSSTLKGTDAFQEVDASAIAKPITKKTYFIQSSEDLYHILPEAFHLSRKGKPGPILIDIPKDIQLQKMEKRKFVFEDTLKFESKPVNTSEISEFINLFNQSKKPLLYIGGGIQAAKASEILMQ